MTPIEKVRTGLFQIKMALDYYTKISNNKNLNPESVRIEIYKVYEALDTLGKIENELEGMVIVPSEATTDMEDCALDRKINTEICLYAGIYKAMIAPYMPKESE